MAIHTEYTRAAVGNAIPFLMGAPEISPSPLNRKESGHHMKRMQIIFDHIDFSCFLPGRQ
jgi:hypothetical protein